MELALQKLISSNLGTGMHIREATENYVIVLMVGEPEIFQKKYRKGEESGSSPEGTSISMGK